MRKLSMSMCASRDYMEGYNKAVDDAKNVIDRYKEALERIAGKELDGPDPSGVMIAQKSVAQEALLH